MYHDIILVFYLFACYYMLCFTVNIHHSFHLGPPSCFINPIMNTILQDVIRNNYHSYGSRCYNPMIHEYHRYWNLIPIQLSYRLGAPLWILCIPKHDLIRQPKVMLVPDLPPKPFVNVTCERNLTPKMDVL